VFQRRGSRESKRFVFCSQPSGTRELGVGEMSGRVGIFKVGWMRKQRNPSPHGDGWHGMARRRRQQQLSWNDGSPCTRTNLSGRYKHHPPFEAPSLPPLLTRDGAGLPATKPFLPAIMPCLPIFPVCKYQIY
jgi:hypothetical protein